MPAYGLTRNKSRVCVCVCARAQDQFVSKWNPTKDKIFHWNCIIEPVSLNNMQINFTPIKNSRIQQELTNSLEFISQHALKALKM
jgi:hypothetical protein